jgi:hypothetical protein
MQSQTNHIDETTTGAAGSRDGHGAGDHDQPYHFGRTPRAVAPYPFNTRQFARLLVLRSRVQAGLLGNGDFSAGVAPA